MKSRLLLAAVLLMPPGIGGMGWSAAYAADTTTTAENTTEDTGSNVIASTQAYNDGLAAVKRGDLVTAATQFEKVVALSPNDSSALMFLGYVRLKQERYDDAITALDRAGKAGSSLDAKARAEIQNNLGIAYWNKKQWDSGIAAYQKALDLNKDYTEARYNLAFALLARHRSQEAVPHFQQLIIKSPNDATLHDGIGEAYENMADWAKALGAYRKAVALDTREALYPLRLALALVNSGRKDEAIPMLQETLKRDPRNASANLQLGVIYIARARDGKANWAEAQQPLARYTELRPNEFIGWYNLGVAYDFAAKFDDALRAYGEAEKINPNDPAVQNNIGRIHYKRARYQEAAAACNKALELDPNFYDALHNLALVYTAQSKLEEANKQWSKLIDLLSRNITSTNDTTLKQNLQGRLVAARAGLAENYLAAEKYREAIIEYKQLRDIAPGNISALSNLALSLYHTKSYAEAAGIYREVIKRDAKNAIAYNNLGVVLEAMNDRAAALENYKLAVKFKPDYTAAQANIDRLRAAMPTG